MVADFVYDGTKIVACNGTSGTPKTFADMHDADLAGTFELLAAWSPDNNTKALTTQLQPAESKGLLIDFVVAAKTAEADFIFITGTDIDGNAQTESLDVTAGNGTYTTTKWFATITNIDCSDNAAGSGTVWADGTVQVIQNRWGVVWEIAEDGQYKIDCNIEFGDNATSTYFQSKNEQIYFADGKIFGIKIAATLELGDLSNSYGIDGSFWSVGPTAGTTILAVGETGTFYLYGSRLHSRDKTLLFRDGTVIINKGQITFANPAEYLKFYSSLASLSIKNLYFEGASQFWCDKTATDFDDVHVHNITNAIVASASITLTSFLATNAATLDAYVTTADTITLKNPKFHPANLRIDNAAGVIIEQYTCNIHVTDKDGADLASVDVDCEYAHLVEGSDSKTYKCIQDHTSVDATHKPITGTNWDEYWELYDAGGGLGGPWQTTFDYKAGTEEFSTAATDANGDIAEQVIDYKIWVGTSELLEARIHKFTFSHASYPDFVMNDVIVDHPLVWEFDMGQSTSDLEAIVLGQIQSYDPPTKTEMDTGHGLLATEAKQDIIDTNVDQIETAVITNAAGTDIAADIIAVKAETALIVEDTSELQTDDVPTLIAALPTAEETVDEFETQSQADPTGFHVNTMEVVGATPLTLSDIRPEMVSSQTRDDNTAATSSVIYTELAEATADHYNNLSIVFTSGVLAGQSRRISDYSHDGTDGIVTVFPAFTEAPDDDSTFIITTPYFYMPLAGAKEFTYIVKDGSANPIAGVTVWISTDEAGSQIVWSGISDANGIIRDVGGNKPWLDVGTVYVWKQKAGYIDDDWPDTEVVS